MPSGFRKPFQLSYDIVPPERLVGKRQHRNCRVEFSYEVFRLPKDAGGHDTGDYIVVNLRKDECFKLAYQLLAFASELPDA